jgi:hypothetical protein
LLLDSHIFEFRVKRLIKDVVRQSLLLESRGVIKRGSVRVGSKASEAEPDTTLSARNKHDNFHSK